MNIGEFLIMLLAFTGAAVTILWTIVAAIGRVKRMERTPGPGQLTTEEIDRIPELVGSAD